MNAAGKILHTRVAKVTTSASTLEAVGFELRNLSSAIKQYALALLEADQTGKFDWLSKEELVKALQEKHQELGYLIEELQ